MQTSPPSSTPWGPVNSGGELRVLCKRRLLVHCVAKAQPGIVGNGQASQHFQETNRPVPPLILQDSSSSFNPVAERWPALLAPAWLRQFLRHIHPMSTHAHRYQCVIVPLIRGWNNADVHMDVRETSSWNTFSNSPKVFLCCSIADISSRINLWLTVFLEDQKASAFVPSGSGKSENNDRLPAVDRQDQCGGSGPQTHLLECPLVLLRGVGQPFTAVQPFLELPQPVGSILESPASFIRKDSSTDVPALDIEFTAGEFFS